MGYNATLIWTHFLKKKNFTLQKICCKKNYLLKGEENETYTQVKRLSS